MKNILLSLMFIDSLTCCSDFKNNKQHKNICKNQIEHSEEAVTIDNPQKYTHSIATELENYFSAAYLQFPNIPKGLLEAIAYDRTQLQLASPYREIDTIIHYDLFKLPNTVVEDYCKNNKVNRIDFLNDEKNQILFIATELLRLKNEKKIDGNNFQDFEYAIDKLFEYVPMGVGYKSYPGNVTICYRLLKGFETNEVKILPNRNLLNYYNSIRPLSCMEEVKSKDYDEK